MAFLEISFAVNAQRVAADSGNATSFYWLLDIKFSCQNWPPSSGCVSSIFGCVCVFCWLGSRSPAGTRDFATQKTSKTKNKRADVSRKAEQALGSEAKTATTAVIAAAAREAELANLAAELAQKVGGELCYLLMS